MSQRANVANLIIKVSWSRCGQYTKSYIEMHDFTLSFGGLGLGAELKKKKANETETLTFVFCSECKHVAAKSTTTEFRKTIRRN